MENVIKTLMTNFMFILIPPIVYFLYWTNSEKKNAQFSRFLMFTTLAGSMLLCMTFPFPYPYQGQFNFDFRHVPLVLGVLYGGPRLSGALLVIFLVYRYFIGGHGFYTGTLIVLAAYFSLVFIKAKYKPDTRNKIILAVWISGVFVPAPLILLTYAFEINTLNLALSSIVFRMIQTLAIFLTIYLIEFVIDHYKMQRKLQESEKLRVVSEIAASVSHEIRNPLTTVKGMLQLMGEKHHPKDKNQEFIHMALTELDSATDIISDYLTFSKPQLEDLRLINLADDCKHVVNVLTPYAHFNQVRLYSSLDPSCIILGDRQKLRQSLINLVKNSIEASKYGTVELILLYKKENAVIQIRDTGVGMTKEQIKRLGTPYYSTKDKGTGLGSMVALSLIKAMNGSVTVDSQVGKGSLFIIAFPHP